MEFPMKTLSHTTLENALVRLVELCLYWLMFKKKKKKAGLCYCYYTLLNAGGTRD